MGRYNKVLILNYLTNYLFKNFKHKGEEAKIIQYCIIFVKRIRFYLQSINWPRAYLCIFLRGLGGKFEKNFTWVSYVIFYSCKWPVIVSIPLLPKNKMWEGGGMSICPPSAYAPRGGGLFLPPFPAPFSKYIMTFMFEGFRGQMAVGCRLEPKNVQISTFMRLFCRGGVKKGNFSWWGGRGGVIILVR